MSSDNASGTALTRTQEFNLQLEQQVQNFKIMLPAHVPLDKFKRVVVTAVMQDPKLFNADRRSLFVAAQKCASDGLLPDGREAVLLPFNTKVKRKLADGTYQDVWVDLVTYIPMVQGIRARMRNTGLVSGAEAYIVYRNDKFFQKFGSDPQIVHEPPALGTPRGDPVGAYAIIRLTSGEVIQEVMDKDEIERIRSFSKSKNGPGWTNHWGEMARKTTLKRAAKSAPTSAEMLQLLDRDDDTAEPGMVDITGAVYEPEPEPARQVADEREPETSYAVIDADGEEHEFATAEAVDKALRAIFDDAERRGAAALKAASENNDAVLSMLHQNGHMAIVRDLIDYWQELWATLSGDAGHAGEMRLGTGEVVDETTMVAIGNEVAADGTARFTAWWNSAEIRPLRDGLRGHLERWRVIAKAADERGGPAPENEHEDPFGLPPSGGNERPNESDPQPRAGAESERIVVDAGLQATPAAGNSRGSQTDHAWLETVTTLRPDPLDLTGDESDWRGFADYFVRLCQQTNQATRGAFKASQHAELQRMRREAGDEYRRCTEALAGRW